MRQVLWVSWVILFCSIVSVKAAETTKIGQKIGDFKLHDFRGAEFAPASWNQSELIVVAFLGTECPLARLYGPRLAELAAEFESKKVQFVAIDANQQDTLAEMAQYARVSKMEFPFLKDPSNHVADLFDAERTPEVFVLDRQNTVRYHGRIDDQFGIGYNRNSPKRRDLAVALDELLADKSVEVAETPITGCHIGRSPKVKPHGELTYANDIAPLLQKHCVACHRPGEVGPFTLTSYDDVASWSSTIREVVEERRMPPWHADSEVGTFVNDRRMSDAEKKQLFDWIDHGMPEGKSTKPQVTQEFVEGWQIPKPELVIGMDQPYTVPAKGTVEYQLFPISATFDEDKWLVASEARPGNRAVVHHLILFYVPPGHKGQVEEAVLKNSVATFAPGIPAWRAPEGTARRIPAGSKLYLQAHYTPNGVETTDLSRMGLVFTDSSMVKKELVTDAVVNPRLRIPPNEDNVLMKADFRFRRDMKLISLLPHMHLRGKAFRIDALEPNGERRLLLNVPRYDFNWQNTYVFAEPISLREGTQILCSAWYDNSEKNLANPDPNQTVGWGDQTWEEMLVAQFEVVLEDQDLQLGRPQVEALNDGEFDVLFSYRPAVKAEAVYLAGTFNKWKPADLKMEGPDEKGVYSTKVKLPAGQHEYKFVVNGKIWKQDPGNPDFMGFYDNSVLTIPKQKTTATTSK